MAATTTDSPQSDQSQRDRNQRERGQRDRRRRGTTAAAVQGTAPKTDHYRQLKNPFPPIEIFSADELEAIHEASLIILKEIGLKVLSDEALALYKGAGADVDLGTQMVRFDSTMVLDLVAKAPPVVTLHSRNPRNNATVGANHVAFATVGGPPNATDLDRGRRAGSLADFKNFLRLAQFYDVIHLLAPAVEPVDIPVNIRHLETTRAVIELTEKVPFFFSRGQQALDDAMDMMRISRGIDEAQFNAEPSCYTVVNANSPLQLDDLMCNGIINAARRGQMMILTPFTLAGAMAPVSIPGALAQQNAEALAGLALSQIAKPGAPVGYGGFTSNVDMKSGAPAFGTPEYVKGALGGGQLARRYSLPYRSSNVNASNHPDAQAAYEGMMSTWGALFGGCNILLHGAGWLEGGLSASFEKFIQDVETLQMMAELFQPTPVDAGTLALEAVREVGPGGHFFGCQHTLERYQDAFYTPLLSDWRNFETWRDDGSVDATWRANRIFKENLAAYQPPPLAPDRREEMEAFIAKRTEEGGAKIG